MNEQKAKEILKGCITKDEGLKNRDHYIHWDNGKFTVTLDDDFKAEELQAIAWWMQNKSTIETRLKAASKVAEDFMCEWTCSESLEDIQRDSWSTSDLHSLLVDFILKQNQATLET